MDLIQRLRKNYKPKNKKINYLIIAESPPACPVCKDEEVRFFYNPKQEKWDFMFKSIMDGIFPKFKSVYRKGEKHKYLKKFEEAGFYMIDAIDTPINNLSERKRNEIIESESENKIKEIEGLISERTPIFLIKKNIWEIFYYRLKDRGYNVAHKEFLPFPSSGWQSKFKEKFKKFLGKVYDCNNVENNR